MEKNMNADLLERRKKVVSNGVGIFVNTTAESAKGAIITDVEGDEYIDLGGGIGVLNAGHCPPKVVEAIKQQADKLLHSCFHVSMYEGYIKLCEKLVEILPHGESTKVMLTNTGVESVENAIKIARQATKRPAVICFSDAFHGRTLMGMSLTSKVNYKMNCGPFAPEIYRIDYPNFYKRDNELNEDDFSVQEIKKLKKFVRNYVDAKSVAAIVIELVQGEGGFNIAPKKYIELLRDFCDKHGIMLIFDEVQTGFCRTGKWGAYEHYGINPDLSTWAKSMGSGLPIGCVIGKAEVMDAAEPGTIGGTYLGNPVCCAAALATIEVMEEEKLNERADKIGKIFMDRFKEFQKITPFIGDVRGIGAMVAIEFVKGPNSKIANAKFCSAFVKKCLEKKVILLKAGKAKNVVRVLSPIVITESEIEKALQIMEETLKELTKGLE
jgi:4-aminobutyrate aminotransferase/(S)-3-amino-2-methylpropionate transaminase